MNILLLLILMGIPSIFSALTLSGRSVSPTPQFIVPRYPSSPLFSRILRSEIPRTILFKNVLELDCLKQLYNQNNSNKKSRSRFEFFKNQGQTPRRPIMRYRGHSFNNKIPPQMQRFSHPLGEEKFLLTPFNYPKPLNHSKNWRLFPTSKYLFKPNFKEASQMKENESDINAKVDRGPLKMMNMLQQERKEILNLEENMKNDINVSKKDENQQLSKDNDKLKYTEVEQISNLSVPVENSSFSKVPLHSYQVSRPKIIQPYEVEEIIEEDIRVDINSDKDVDFENKNFHGKEINKQMELMDDEPETSTQKIPNNMMAVLDNSINKILKGLIQPESKKEKTHKNDTGSKDAINTWVVPGEFKEGSITEKNRITLIPPFLDTTMPKYFSQIHNEKEKFNKVEIPSDFNRNSEYRAKSLIPKNERKNTMQNASFANGNEEIWRLHPVESNSFKASSTSSPDSSDLENISKNLKIFEENSKKFFNSKDPSEIDTKIQLTDLFNFYNGAKPETEASLPSLPELFSYSMHPQDTKQQMTEESFQFSNLQPNDSSFGPTFSILPSDDSNLSDDAMPNTTKQFTFEKKIDDPGTTTKTNAADPDELSIQKDFSLQKKTDFPERERTSTQAQWDDNNQNKENSTGLEEAAKKSTEIKFNFDVTPMTLKQEININLDVGSKNSRKMHYGQDVDNSLDETTEQRRSDILINEALNDYEENLKENSPSKYLKILRDNISRNNFSINMVIPNIPSIINDIREGNLGPEEILLISKAMGKYWPAILAVSNNTNFDMLPLLKMKNENDLETFLKDSVRDDSVAKTTLESVYDLTNDMNYGGNYDYDYKDLYQDITVEDFDFKTKKKFRPAREIDNHLQRLRAEKAIFYGIGNRDVTEETEVHSRIKRNKEEAEPDWKAEATREYFESLEEEQNGNVGDYLYDEIFYSDLAEGKELIQAELVEATDLQVTFQNVTS